MSAVVIRGAGVRCALGADVAACSAALLAGGKPPARATLAGLTEPSEVAYYRIDDGDELFDPGRFGRLLPGVVQDAVAGLSTAERERLPLFIGSSCFSIGQSETGYAAALARSPAQAYPMPHCGYDWLASLVRQAIGGGGANYTYNTACTSSANALLGACRALQVGRHRHALVLGAELANLTTLSGFSGLQLLSDQVRPFEAEREGLVLGEGIGAVLLSADGPSEAMRLHDGASNCDTFSITTADPEGTSVAAVLHQALSQARLRPEAIRGIKAHGTGTPSGDLAEAAGLRKVFPELPPFSILKPYIGHTLGACGVIELVLYAGALAQGRLPARSSPVAADPELGIQPLKVSRAAAPGYYLLNQFGFGGNNAVLVLEKPA
jgi:3-oxoacyl-[acyl-carrier-protein] synthase-1